MFTNEAPTLAIHPDRNASQLRAVTPAPNARPARRVMSEAPIVTLVHARPHQRPDASPVQWDCFGLLLASALVMAAIGIAIYPLL